MMPASEIMSVLPEALALAAYTYEGESAWTRDNAREVIRCARELGLAVIGVEVWVPLDSAPLLPGPYVYAYDAGRRKRLEKWAYFVERCADEAEAYVAQFEWDSRDTHHQRYEPYFNLEFQSRAERASG